MVGPGEPLLGLRSRIAGRCQKRRKPGSLGLRFMIRVSSHGALGRHVGPLLGTRRLDEVLTRVRERYFLAVWLRKGAAQSVLTDNALRWRTWIGRNCRIWQWLEVNSYVPDSFVFQQHLPCGNGPHVSCCTFLKSQNFRPWHSQSQIEWHIKRRSGSRHVITSALGEAMNMKP